MKQIYQDFKKDVIKQLQLRGGRNSISCLIQDLKYEGWSKIGKPIDLIKELENMGFKIEEIKDRTYIKLF